MDNKSHISDHNSSDNLSRPYRQDLWANDFRPVPVRTKDKAPSGRDWPGDARQNPPPCAAPGAKPTAWAQSTGILCDGLRAVDVDIDDPEIVSRIRAELTSRFGVAPVRVRKNSARILVVYRAAEGEPKKRVLKGTAGKVEILGHGQQFVADGIHPDGDRYAWDGPDLLTTPRSTLPAVTEAQIDALFTALAPVIGAAVAEPVPAKVEPVRAVASASISAGARERAFAEAALEENARELSDCGEGGRNNTLNGIAFRMGRLIGAGWIGPERVEQELFVACQDNGLIRDDGMASVRKTLASGLRAGIADPHEALDPDGEEDDPFGGERLFPGKAEAATVAEYVDPVTGEILPRPWAVARRLTPPIPFRCARRRPHRPRSPWPHLVRWRRPPARSLERCRSQTR